MTRAPLAALAAALLLAGCSKDGDHSAAAAADSAANAAPSSPSGLLGAPDRARIGADSSNAAVQRREDEVNQLSNPSSGTPTP